MTLPRYEYKCRKCYGTTRTNHRADNIFCHCGGMAVRRFGFSFKRPMEEHWNATVGQPIRTIQQFTTHLARMADEVSERTGIESRFEVIDSSTPSAHGVTEQGLYETQKHLYDNNIDPGEMII